MCNAWNHHPDCTCGWGGEGHFAVRGPETFPVGGRGWSIYDAEKPLTHSTKCWWCGADVFFHRDENGGCVLFNFLGPPWPIHDCWEDHTRQISISSRVESEIDALGYNGTFYKCQGICQNKPESDDMVVVISGYIADNYYFYQDKNLSCLRSHPRADSLNLIKVEVAGRGKLYPFLVPEALAPDIPDYSFVEIRGKWQRRAGRWVLLATKLRRIKPGVRRGRFVETLSIEGVCCICGIEIAQGISWGLDGKGRQECSTCGEMRGKMNRETFLEHISTIRLKNV
jgi:hypothetical protein